MEWIREGRWGAEYRVLRRGGEKVGSGAEKEREVGRGGKWGCGVGRWEYLVLLTCNIT